MTSEVSYSEIENDPDAVQAMATPAVYVNQLGIMAGPGIGAGVVRVTFFEQWGDGVPPRARASVVMPEKLARQMQQTLTEMISELDAHRAGKG